MTDRVAVEARAVTRRFVAGETVLEVLRGIDVTVAAGEMVGIVGPSGSGKSTLLQCLGGLDEPSSGSVVVEGRDLSAMKADERARLRNERVGFVFQFHHLLPDFSALENVMLPRLIAGDNSSAASGRARELLESVGLGARVSHTPSELSGGEQQRVAVARALANDPAVVFADEPSGNLDVRQSGLLHGLLEELRRTRNVTFVIATHDPELANRTDRVLAIREGVLVPAERDDPTTWVSSGAEVGQ